MTVPCLELTASTVAVRLNSMIQQHLGVYLLLDGQYVRFEVHME